MKLSFSKSSGKPPIKQSTTKFTSTTEDLNQSSQNKEYLSVFDSSKKTLDPSKPIIAPLPNTDEWTSRKKSKVIDLPIESDDPNNLEFVVDTSLSVDPTESNISYGLNIRSGANNDGNKGESNLGEKAKSSIESSMLKKFKEDLKNLPDDMGMEEFEGMSVEDFAPALLAGYGWVEGRGIGRNAKDDVKVVEYKRRTAKEGLGFVGELPTEVVKDKEKVKGKENGGGRFNVGKDVRIVGGNDVGLKGRIVEVIKGGDSLVLKVLRSGKEVVVRSRDVADLGSVEEERCLKKLKGLKIRGSDEESGGRDRRRGKDSVRESNDGKRKNPERERERYTTRESYSGSWLNRNIRVRIVSKELKRGKLYLQKGQIVDVVSPTTCDISMDSSRELIQGVEQEFLETALPRRGGPVLVLFGKHKGVYGSLVEKDTENETAVVQDADSHAMINVRLEQIAEYTGDPSDIGY